jgi:hypothetical protein
MSDDEAESSEVESTGLGTPEGHESKKGVFHDSDDSDNSESDK